MTIFSRANEQKFNWTGDLEEWEDFWRSANPAFPSRIKKKEPMTSVLIIENEAERKKVKDFFNGLEFDYVFVNHVESCQKLEGLRYTQVWYTPDVMIKGMDYDLFHLLHRTLVATSLRFPMKGFRLLG